MFSAAKNSPELWQLESPALLGPKCAVLAKVSLHVGKGDAAGGQPGPFARDLTILPSLKARGHQAVAHGFLSHQSLPSPHFLMSWIFILEAIQSDEN